jgi:peptidoglycan glycosyltransferase
MKVILVKDKKSKNVKKSAYHNKDTDTINLKEIRKSKKKKNSNKEIMHVTYVIFGLFLSLMIYFAYFNAVEGKNIINNSYNKRQEKFAERVVRGKILANDSTVLAETKIAEDGTETRYYPYGEMFAHVVGTSTKGMSGIESSKNFELLTSNANMFEKIYNELIEEKNIGDNIVTTLDVELQQVAYEALGNYNGAVIVMEPSTGKILAMVSKPDFNPNQIDEIWDSLIASDGENTSLLNRATQGLYPPGSTFKVLTALEYIRENPDSYLDYSFDCDGIFTLDGQSINCYNKTRHGHENFASSFANSCNSSFANIGTSLNIDSFAQLCNSLLFNSDLPLSFAYSKSSFVLDSSASTWEVMQTVIGQGKTQITPMHNAMIVSAIANGGNLMKPYLVDRVENYRGTEVKKYMPSSYGMLMTADEASILTQLMEEVVQKGTASKLKGASYTAAGKTGSAEFNSNKDSHAWFIGFAPAENPELAVSIIVEESGAGSEYAVPIAKKIFDAYFN